MLFNLYINSCALQFSQINVMNRKVSAAVISSARMLFTEFDILRMCIVFFKFPMLLNMVRFDLAL